MPSTRSRRRSQGLPFGREGAPVVVFYILAGIALLSIVSILTIRADSIDYDRARGLHDGPSTSREKPSGRAEDF